MDERPRIVGMFSVISGGNPKMFTLSDIIKTRPRISCQPRQLFLGSLIVYFRNGVIFIYVNNRHTHSSGPMRKTDSQSTLTTICTT